jgi:hypothetical protein
MLTDAAIAITRSCPMCLLIKQPPVQFPRLAAGSGGWQSLTMTRALSGVKHPELADLRLLVWAANAAEMTHNRQGGCGIT